MIVGSVQRPKGHWLLLDALPHLPSDVHLVLVTGGAPPEYGQTLRGRLKRTLGLPLDNLGAYLRDAQARGLADRMHVTGFRSDIPQVVAAADVLAFPSLLPEGFGRPIIEAMAAERPVVATDVGPSRELLGTHAGLLVPPDARLLADAVADLLDNPARRAQMGQAGRQRVADCFPLDRQVADMSAVFRQVAALG